VGKLRGNSRLEKKGGGGRGGSLFERDERSRNLFLINISKRLELNPPIQRGEGG